MFESLIHFFLVITVQFIFFVAHAFMVGESRNILLYLRRGLLIGIPFGVMFDLIFGKVFGFWDYTFGYTWWFLTINSLFSYGLMIANILLLRHHSMAHMYLWSILLALTYEITNYFLPVWEWTFYDKNPSLEYVFVILVAYTGLTTLMMTTMRHVYKFHFRLLPF